MVDVGDDGDVAELRGQGGGHGEPGGERGRGVYPKYASGHEHICRQAESSGQSADLPNVQFPPAAQHVGHNALRADLWQIGLAKPVFGHQVAQQVPDRHLP